jgi:hypothetical protein
MSLADTVGLLGPGIYFALVLKEMIRPARTALSRKSWRWIGLASLRLFGAVSGLVPSVIHKVWWALLSGTPLGVMVSAVFGLVVVGSVTYVRHRISHNVGRPWWALKQLHRKPECIATTNDLSPSNGALRAYAVRFALALLVFTASMPSLAADSCRQKAIHSMAPMNDISRIIAEGCTHVESRTLRTLF